MKKKKDTLKIVEGRKDQTAWNKRKQEYFGNESYFNGISGIVIGCNKVPGCIFKKELGNENLDCDLSL